MLIEISQTQRKILNDSTDEVPRIDQFTDTEKQRFPQGRGEWRVP